MKQLIPLLLVVVSFQSWSQTEVSRKDNFNIKKSIAIDGYDPVSYFANKPLEGSEELRCGYKGIIYQFATKANLEMFKKNPDKYEPAYGGWCAYAMGATGEKVKIDPETFKIVGGRLFLFYNFWGNNTLESWNKDEHKLQTNADKNWSKIVQQHP